VRDYLGPDEVRGPSERPHERRGRAPGEALPRSPAFAPPSPSPDDDVLVLQSADLIEETAPPTGAGGDADDLLALD
jgi:hypothetical protein